MLPFISSRSSGCCCRRRRSSSGDSSSRSSSGSNRSRSSSGSVVIVVVSIIVIIFVVIIILAMLIVGSGRSRGRSRNGLTRPGWGGSVYLLPVLSSVDNLISRSLILILSSRFNSIEAFSLFVKVKFKPLMFLVASIRLCTVARISAA